MGRAGRQSGFQEKLDEGVTPWRAPCRPPVVAIQMPSRTVSRPTIWFHPTGSCSSSAPNRAAVTGFTVTETATRVGVVRSSA